MASRRSSAMLTLAGTAGDLAEIERAAAEGTLADAPFYFDIVRAWAYMGKADKAKAVHAQRNVKVKVNFFIACSFRGFVNIGQQKSSLSSYVFIKARIAAFVRLVPFARVDPFRLGP